MSRLRTEGLTLAYDGEPVLEGVTLDIPDGKVTSIIGPNGCGKSTLLRALVRLMKPGAGAALLDGQAVHRQPTKLVARQLGLLAQGQTAPDAITVEDLVRRGRFPHQSMFAPPTDSDRIAIDRAIALAGIEELRTRAVDELSGGQRQRAWIAMVLAQDTPLLLLDEPTTYLDLAHQQEVLDLVRRLNVDEGKTVAMVLHDVNEAARISDHVIAIRDGRIVAQGSPADVIRPDVLSRVFAMATEVVHHPTTGAPICIPRGEPDRRERVPGGGTSRLGIRDATLGYDGHIVAEQLSVDFPDGAITAIVGPNACGKSTMLKALARLLTPIAGTPHLDGEPLRSAGRRSLAQRLGLLPQAPVAPPDITVEDLVAGGRTPHQRWYRQWSIQDESAVSDALDATGTAEFRHRDTDALSGGQRQRAWLAMALTRHTPIMLLDEPTTFLDMAHQVEILDLVRTLNRAEGRTVVMVLHDLTQACRYADHLVVMRAGAVVASGAPRDIVTSALVRNVFGVEAAVVTDEVTGRPLVLPYSVETYRDLQASVDERPAPLVGAGLSVAVRLEGSRH